MSFAQTLTSNALLARSTHVTPTVTNRCASTIWGSKMLVPEFIIIILACYSLIIISTAMK